MFCVKIHRLIKSYFGNYKNFIAWCFAVALAIYAIDSLITPKITHPRTRYTILAPKEISTRTIATIIDEHQEEYEQQEKKAFKIPVIHAIHCGLSNACPRGKFSYYIRSGYGQVTSATICFNENYIVAEDKVASDRGLNMVVINDATLNVEEIKVFDVYASDESLIDYLRNNVRDNHLIFVTSQDEASFNLSSVARKEFHKFGSTVLDRVNFRDNYALIGQKGIDKGLAIEGHQPRKENMQFAESASISGCMTIPVGVAKESVPQSPVKTVKVEKKPEEKPRDVVDLKKPVEKASNEKKIEKKVEAKDEKKVAELHDKKKEKPDQKSAEKKPQPEKKGNFKLGQEAKNCGVTSGCPDGGFPVHLYTGFQAAELPKICVGGKYIMSEGLNDAGRGLNVVIVDPKTKEVSRVARFDTYGSDDNSIELFLEMLNDGDIFLAVAHDEASNKLETPVREMLEGLGSSYIHRLAFRDVWAFVGQKGIQGFSPYEEFEFSDANSEKQVLLWPKSIDKRFCVQPKLKGLPQRRILVKNEARMHFCKKHDGYGEFCNKENINLPLLPAPLADKSLENDVIFTIPVAIIAGLEYNSLRKQLDALLANPGIKVEKIVVFYDEKFEEAGELATIFNVSSHKLESSIKYTELMEKAIIASWKQFPRTHYLIVLEEEVFPSTDFLNFFRQCLPAVEADNTLAGISAWNDNAYQGRAGLRNMAYRSELLPGIGFLLKKSFYEEQIKDRMTDCCMRRSWEGWKREKMAEFEMIIPDVSRVERAQYNGRMTDLLKELFSRPREMTGYGASKQYIVTNADALVPHSYEAQLEQLIPTAGSLNRTELQKCLSDKNFIYPINTLVKGSYAVYFEQQRITDDKTLFLLCRCFNLFHVPGYKLRGTHQGLIRFSHDDHMVFLIGSKTEYFNLKPDEVEPLQASKGA